MPLGKIPTTYSDTPILLEIHRHKYMAIAANYESPSEEAGDSIFYPAKRVKVFLIALPNGAGVNAVSMKTIFFHMDPQLSN